MTNRAAHVALTAAALLAAPGFADVEPHAGMLRYPDIGRDSIVFSYANDLWIVDRDGGQAVPLASPPGAEGFPKFSPDDETIAFVGNYDGNRDLYTIPVTGGLPHRVTHHPTGEILCDWTGDRLLFYGFGIQGMPRRSQLFVVGAEGGLPEMLPVPYGAAGAISPDGKWLAYTPHTRDFRSWKRYRGGMATDIWLFNLESHESRKITDWEGTDTLPMWHGERLYYLSDRGDGKLNLWRYDIGEDEHEQLTEFDDYDVKWPSIGPGNEGQGEIVFQSGATLRVLDLGAGTTRQVEVRIPGARPTLRQRRVDASELTRWWHISAKGKRALVEARGDIWTLPAEHGAPRNLTRTSGAAEREASWSPDGQWIAYFSDATGEYELYITQSDGKGETKQLTTGSQTYYFDPVWSPDSKHIVFTDKASRYHLHTLETGETKIVDRNPWAQASRPSWSHDSRWLAYARTREDRPSPSVWLYNIETEEHHEVTSGVFNDQSPTFDRRGDYLYLTSQRVFGSPRYSELDTTWVYTKTNVLLAVPLREDVEAPWPAESDEETWDDEDEAEEEGEENGEGNGEDADADADEDEEESEPPAPDDGVSGRWEGTADTPEGQIPFTLTLELHADNAVSGSLNAMIYSGPVTGTYDPDAKELTLTVTVPEGPVILFELKVEDGTVTGTATANGEVVDISANRTAGASDDEADEEADEEDEEEEAPEILEIDLEGFESRAIMLPVPPGRFGELAVNDKNHLVYVRFGDGEAGIKIFDIEDDKKEEKSIIAGVTGYELSGDGKKLIALRGTGTTIHGTTAGASGKRVVTDGMIAHIDPREEWKQIFVEAWRLQRDFLYVENMHGVDWPAVREQYEKMLEDCMTRNDVGYIIREMIAELNIGHAYYFGGDLEDEPSVSVGMLGVDWEIDDGAYRIAQIQEGAAWDVDARSPLREASEKIAKGDYLLAVNGVPVDPEKDPWAAFRDTAGRTITITVSQKPVMDEEARDVVVKPVGSEGGLRYRAWIERNRAYVEEKTGGKVGYIYVPDTGINGQNDLVRQYYSQIHKPGLIIDERWNGGGQIPTRFIEMLNRPVTNYWARRDLKAGKWPPDAHHGPKCMLINGLAGSGGDMFPWLFRQAGLGPLIGTRTWGGLVGLSGNPSLVDGAQVTVPTFGFYEKDGTWGVEGHGVDPDMEVIDDPALMVDGGDPQLDAAIEYMLEEIENNPYEAVEPPAPPDRSGIGITEEDK